MMVMAGSRGNQCMAGKIMIKVILSQQIWINENSSFLSCCETREKETFQLTCYTPALKLQHRIHLINVQYSIYCSVYRFSAGSEKLIIYLFPLGLSI